MLPIPSVRFGGPVYFAGIDFVTIVGCLIRAMADKNDAAGHCTTCEAYHKAPTPKPQTLNPKAKPKPEALKTEIPCRTLIPE